MKKYCSECQHYNSHYDKCQLRKEVVKEILHKETHIRGAYIERRYKKYIAAIKNKNHDCADFQEDGYFVI